MKRILNLTLLIFFISISLVSASYLQETEKDTIIVTKNLSPNQFNKVLEFLKEYGEVRHAYTDGVFIGKFKVSDYSKLIKYRKIKKVSFSKISNYRDFSDDQIKILKSWNNLEQSGKERYPELDVSWEDIGIEGIEEINYVHKLQDESRPFIGGSHARWETSEYFIGSTAVGILLPESDGSIDPNTEDWTSGEEAEVIAGIRDAMDWYISFEPRANLSFVYDINYKMPTSYEAISRPHTDANLWRREILQDMGYSSNEYLREAQDYIADLREDYNTDWGFLAWVVDASEDQDHRFQDEWSAWAAIQGPSWVSRFRGQGDHEYFKNIAAHETGHIFGALDKYCGGSEEGTYCCSCTEKAGYYQIQNTNCAAGCPEGNCDGGEPSCNGCNQCTDANDIMNDISIWNLSTVSKQQFGWIDSDGDGIFDPVDTNQGECNLYLPNQLFLDLDGFLYYTVDLQSLVPGKIDTSNMDEEDIYFDGLIVDGAGRPSVCHLPQGTQAYMVYGCCNTYNTAAPQWDEVWSKFYCLNGFDNTVNGNADPRYPDFDLNGKLDPYPQDLYPIPKEETGMGIDIYCGWNIYIDDIAYPAGNSNMRKPIMFVPDNQKNAQKVLGILSESKEFKELKKIDKRKEEEKSESKKFTLLEKIDKKIKNFFLIPKR